MKNCIIENKVKNGNRCLKRLIFKRKLSKLPENQIDYLSVINSKFTPNHVNDLDRLEQIKKVILLI